MAHVSSSFQFQHLEMHLTLNSVNMSIHCLFYWFRNSHLANVSHLSNMLCPQRCSTRARRKVTPNLECFENEEGESGEGNSRPARFENEGGESGQGQLMHFSTGTLGWTYYWLPHSYKHSADHVFPLSCSMAEKKQMSQETMGFKDEAAWKHF